MSNWLLPNMQGQLPPGPNGESTRKIALQHFHTLNGSFLIQERTIRWKDNAIQSVHNTINLLFHLLIDFGRVELRLG